MRDYYGPKRQYVGQLDSKGLEHGLGIYTVNLEGKCAGDFMHNRVTGRAIKTWEQGEKFIGDYHMNKKHGIGLHEWPTGARYRGQFKNNQPDGYGILETVHDGIKFIGRVKGMTAMPVEGKWYDTLNNQIDPEDHGIASDGTKTLPNGVKVTAIGEVAVVYTDDEGREVRKFEEKNIKSETWRQGPYNYEYGKRETYYYGDWIYKYEGYFASGRYHGPGTLEYNDGGLKMGNYCLGKMVEHNTYTDMALRSDKTRSIERRMQRHYSLVYDVLLSHYFSIRDKDYKPVIVEFGVGKGEHMQFWRKLFPNATIVGVDRLGPDSTATNELEEQQIRDIQQAAQMEGFEFMWYTDAYDKQNIYDLVTKYGDIDIAIHDATHHPDAWDKLDTIIECLQGPNGILFTEEFGCLPEANNPEAVLKEQIQTAKEKGWRIWDMRPLHNYQFTNSLIGVYSHRWFDAGDLNLYEVHDETNL